MWLARCVMAAFLSIAAVVGPAGAEGDAEAFTRRVVDRAFAITGSEALSSHEKHQQFEALVGEAFDTEGAGPFLLGSYWISAHPRERRAFRSAFGAAISDVYMDRLYLYPGQKFVIDGHRSNGDPLVVESRLTANGGRPDTRVHWHVVKRHGAFRIIDIVFDGVSVNSELRREYLSVVRRHDGQLGALVDSMARQHKLSIEAEC